MPCINHIARQVLTGLAATIILALATGTTSARNLSISTQNFRATWASLELSNTVNLVTVRCPVTLEGSFHTRTIAKVLGTLIGYITRAEVDNTACTDGRATALHESLPWHISYLGFTGTLPNIGTVRLNLIRASYQIESPEGRTCLSATTTASPAGGIINLGAGGVVTGLRADETRNIPLRDPPGRLESCFFGSGRFRGVAAVVQLGTTTRVTVTLI